MKRAHIFWLLLATTATLTAAPAQRQNVLFCFADDWGRYAGAYAKLDGKPSLSEVVKTPNIDLVAQRGVLFKNAFVSAPSCTPCRSALLSGRYFFNTGRAAILQGAIWDGSVPSFPLQLREAGYHIGKSFKVWTPGTPADAPFGGQQFAYQKAGGELNNFSENVTRRVREGQPLADARAKIHEEVRGNFTAFLADRKAGQPWFFWFGPTTVHRTWVKGSGKA
ncbi:MAG: sulfatase, partial [Pedosphaera sp.]|nr:sulfatase [Pedosphaera sp.]